MQIQTSCFRTSGSAVKAVRRGTYIYTRSNVVQVYNTAEENTEHVFDESTSVTTKDLCVVLVA